MAATSSRIDPFDFAPLTEEDRKRIAQGMKHTFSGAFLSLVENDWLPWRNSRELAALSLFELDHRAEQIEVLPERITVTVDGHRVSHIPAFRLRRGASTVVVDILTDGQVKALKLSDNPTGESKLTAALKRAYATRGVRYETLPYALVRAQPRYRNARLVLRGRRYEPPAETEIAILSALSTPGPHTVRSIAKSLPGHSNVREAVYSLATRRRVAIELWARDPYDMSVRLASWEKRR